MPATAVGPRDLGGIALRLRAQGRVEAAVRWASDPRRGKRGRDGLRMPNLERGDPSCNFRPVLLAALGDWEGLADWCRLYDEAGWQLREWGSPTYTARVLAAVAVGAAQAPAGPERAAMRRCLNRWLDLLALIAVPAPPRPLWGDYGGVRLEIARPTRWTCAIAPAGMRANRWTALQHSADGLLDMATAPDGRLAHRVRRRDARRPRPPDDPREHVRPAPDRADVTFAHVWRELAGREKDAPLHKARRDGRRAAVRGGRDALERIVGELISSHSRTPLRTWGPLEVRIQRRRYGAMLQEVLVALSRATSRNKGAVTAARLTPETLFIQAVSPLRASSPQPDVSWTDLGCTAESGPRRSTVRWLERPEIDLVVSRRGVERR